MNKLHTHKNLIGDVIDWANKADPKDVQKWEYFMDQYLISMKWERNARKQLIAMGENGFCYSLLHIETKIEDFYGDVHYCSDRMFIDRLLRCHIQYRTLKI